MNLTLKFIHNGEVIAHSEGCVAPTGQVYLSSDDGKFRLVNAVHWRERCVAGRYVMDTAEVHVGPPHYE